MTSLSRLAVAALLTGAVALPAFAQDEHGAPPSKQHITRVAAGPEVTKPTPGKPAPGKPDAGKSAEKPAAMTGNAGSHAPVTQAAPPASGELATKTN